MALKRERPERDCLFDRVRRHRFARVGNAFGHTGAWMLDVQHLTWAHALNTVQESPVNLHTICLLPLSSTRTPGVAIPQLESTVLRGHPAISTHPTPLPVQRRGSGACAAACGWQRSSVQEHARKPPLLHHQDVHRKQGGDHPLITPASDLRADRRAAVITSA